MPVEIILEDAVKKLQGTVNTILEIRCLFGKQNEGFRDVYPTAKNERTALGTCEFLMCLLLPMDVLGAVPRYQDQFSYESMLSSDDVKQYILNDIQYVIIEVTRSREADSDSKPIFDTEKPFLDGKPYAYYEEKGVISEHKFAQSIDAAAFILSTFVLIKEHFTPLLESEWENHTLGEWVDQMIQYSIHFLKNNIYEGKGFFDHSTDETPDDKSLLFFTWTAVEALTTAANSKEPEAEEIFDTALIPNILPSIEKLMRDFPDTNPSDIKDQNVQIENLYKCTHLLIISSLLKSSASQDIEKLIKLSFQYWDELQIDFSLDKKGQMRNIYKFGEFQIDDIGIFPLYHRALLLSLQNPSISEEAKSELESKLGSTYSQLGMMYPQPPDVKNVQEPLSTFDKNKWIYLGSNAKDGVHFIFLTERVIEAYATTAEYLLSYEILGEEVRLDMMLSAPAFEKLFQTLWKRLQPELDGFIQSKLDKAIAETKTYVEDNYQKKTGSARLGGKTGLTKDTEQKRQQCKNLLKIAKTLVLDQFLALHTPQKSPPPAEINRMKSKIEQSSLEIDGLDAQTIPIEIRALEEFLKKYDENIIKKAKDWAKDHDSNVKNTGGTGK